MTRLFVIAPTPMLRAGLRAMLTTSDIEVVGDAPALSNATDLRGAAGLVVTELGQLENLARAAQDNRLFIIVLTDDSAAATTLRRFELSGWGLVLPDAGGPELEAAVQAVSQGMVVLPTRLTEQLLETPASNRRGVELLPLDEPLTGREREVLELLGQGLSNKLIARSLQISEHTVKFHVSSLYAKLGAASRTEAVNQGARRGLITL